MNGELGKRVLKGVSRSFYLTLRLLPGPMRAPASLAYLLARTSDTLADSADAPVGLRQECLEKFRIAVMSDCQIGAWPREILISPADSRERLLLEMTGQLLEWLARTRENERLIIREVIETIIGGQKLDLDRFAEATVENPISLADEAALEDYSWRVAGCVGGFWTKLGFATLGDRFSRHSEGELHARGVVYGKGLQLVNILRDLPADLALGRCYLPVANPRDLSSLLECHARWVERASAWVGEGENYADGLCSRRLRVASVLPALIAGRTLEALRGVSWEDLQAGVKVPRREIYGLLLSGLFRNRGDC